MVPTPSGLSRAAGLHLALDLFAPLVLGQLKFVLGLKPDPDLR
jgi:hypothetical protein